MADSSVRSPTVARAFDWLRASWLDLTGVLAAAIYALPSLWYPAGNDSAIHWYIGRGLLNGELPYVAGVDTRPPGPFYVHAASILLFGDRQASVRIVDLLFVVGCAALIATFRPRRSIDAGLSRKRLRGELGIAALLTTAIHYTFFDDYAVGHPELWQAFFMLGTLWVVARVPDGRPRIADALAAGALAGTAVMFKHTAVLSGLLGGLALTWLAIRDRGAPWAFRIAGAFTGGVFASMALLVLPFVVGGALGPFYEVMVRFILTYGGSAPAGTGALPPWLGLQYGGLAAIFAITAWLVGASVATRSRQRGGAAFAAWVLLGALVALVTVAVQKRGWVIQDFNYHFIVLGPFLALAIHWGLRQHFGARLAPRFAWVLVLMAVSFAWEPAWPFAADEWSYRKEWASWAATMRGEQSRTAHLVRYGYRKNALDHYDRHELVGRWISERAEPEDTLCVRGCAAPIYQVTGLRCPSRFFSQDTVDYGLPEWAPEHARDLEASPPRFLVTFSDRRDEIRSFQSRGYELHDDLERRPSPRYVVLERPRSGAVVSEGEGRAQASPP